MFFSLHKCHLCLFQTKYSEGFQNRVQDGTSLVFIRLAPLTIAVAIGFASCRCARCVSTSLEAFGRCGVFAVKTREGDERSMDYGGLEYYIGVLAMLKTLQPSRAGLEEHAIILVTHHAHVFPLNKRIGT